MYRTHIRSGKDSERVVVEVITGVQRRRRWTPEEKQALVKQTFELGMTVGRVARIAGIFAMPLFQCEKTYSESFLVAVGADEAAVAISKTVETQKQVKQPGATLGRTTHENEIRKEAVEYGNARTCIARAPTLPGDRQ